MNQASSLLQEAAAPELQARARLPRMGRPRNCSYAEDDWEILSKFWFPVARADDIGAKPVASKLLDVKLVVYRTTSGINVARDLCPHRGVPLSMGWVESDELVCAYHGLRFAADGRCVKIPAQPNVVPSDRFRATNLPAVERYGLVWTCLDPDNAAGEIPPFPEFDGSDFQAIVCPPVTMQAAPGRQVEGFIDVAHFAWIHHEAFANREKSMVPLYQTKSTDYGFQTIYISDVSNFPKAVQHLEPEGFIWKRTFDVHPPFVAFLTVDFPNEGVLKIMNIATPVSARETTLYVPLVRNFDRTGSVEDVYAFNAQIFAEDQAIVEAQCPEDLPLDPDEEAHFAADRSSVAYRKALRQLGLSG
ncbi:aromatic ring-hydroxylating oxygenase subunit alpha [Sphingobium sp. Ant17]|uniref:aromatic ring-hydroxylating oxygenase subunit alpha n=1 Tax=Sphingobium sp. Ant17 TaxID=1461752 RepID=UPI000452556B|nr:aromatic ring-hydroxylating dioxygenase subunit alpha [Sphingobium sp. Ant17]EXS71224.1 oxidoreductase [Sphingobium sp. Ant17]